jgi:hypothetical protein
VEKMSMGTKKGMKRKKTMDTKTQNPLRDQQHRHQNHLLGDVD